MYVTRGGRPILDKGISVEFGVGDIFTIIWSNGGGQTIYRIKDNPKSTTEIQAAGELPHLFEVVAEKEYGV